MVLISIAELIPAALEHGLDAQVTYLVYFSKSFFFFFFLNNFQTVAFWNVIGMALMAVRSDLLHNYQHAKPLFVCGVCIFMFLSFFPN